ncbi:hypothetical protein DKM44_08155 [Deinococcus irradiatisoli]|uniref:Type 4 fimbrial biogenesis protein PilX N-terminal domain-containing protein n=1 Tax=Deinococcus irradiatisoli TaxID=2202254 RepID=A0A2Z3JIJ6_9DEIO|nr:pilus assembly PilX N-terminal domain-containing protein [Deinococcus irradiatisoli]AWN23200.1 hypothetical protein DKM44_08155 [Deinococcus irradiatisoli]
MPERRWTTDRSREQGVALVSALIMMAVLMAILAAYTTLTLSGVRSGKYSLATQQGFYAAEGGLNLRAEQVRAKFTGYLRPTGLGPSSAAPCSAGDPGSGDMRCVMYTIGQRRVYTYVRDITKYAGSDPESGTVAPGDVYAGLNYQQYAYRVYSAAYNAATNEREASLYMDFQSRLVPLFQFAAFYQGDLEFHPGPPMTLNGRVHTNGDLFLNAGNTLSVTGKTTASGSIYRFGKDGRPCAGSVSFSGIEMPCVNGSSTDLSADKVTGPLLAPFDRNVLDQQQVLTTPGMASLRPDPLSVLWMQADVRVVADPGAAPMFTVRRADRSLDTQATNRLNSCNAVKASSLYDGREQKTITLMQVDQQKLMDCISGGGFTAPNGSVLKIDDESGGGMVWNFSFTDADPAKAALINGGEPYPTAYGVEIVNAARLGPSSGSDALGGLTIVSNQQVYLRGDYNALAKKPSAVLADAINVLSSAADEPITGNKSTGQAAPTTVNAAFLSGIDVTTSSNYNGGLQNYIRFHESWSGVRMTYRGSFVSLGQSLHTVGRQAGAGIVNYYDPPDRDWGYDTDFNNASNLPPLTPRFVYLRQLLFARSW